MRTNPPLSWLGCLFVAFFMPTVCHAQGGGIQYSQESTRHFEGERFLTTAGTRVFAQPSVDSRVLRDVPRMRMVYARPAKNGWREVVGVGFQSHPYNRQGMREAVDVKDGKLDLRLERVDRNVYRRASGYIQDSALGSLDHPASLPDDLKAKLAPIPGPLEDIGVPERRTVPRQPWLPPFGSVIRVIIAKNDDKAVQSCSGFVVEKPGLVATAAHCIAKGGKDPRIYILVPTKESGFRLSHLILTKVIYFSGDDEAGDSALLQVDDPRAAGLAPLPLATPGPWTNAVAVEVMTAGFAGDLDSYKQTWLQSEIVPHVDTCVLTGNQMHVQVDGTLVLLHTIASNVDCVTGPGDSGGPALLWNADTKRYEVFGIAAWVANRDLPQFKLTAKARALLEEASAKHKVKYPLDRWKMGGIQGLNVLRGLAGATAETYKLASAWMIDGRLYDEVAKLTGKPSGYQSMLSTMIDKNSPMLRETETVTSIVNNDFLLDEYRAARRALATTVSLPAATAKQARETYGDRLDGDSLTAQGLRWTEFMFGDFRGLKFHIGQLLVPKIGFKEYARTIQPEIDAVIKADPEIVASIQRRMGQINEESVVEVGPDLYVVKSKGARITEVIRDWLQEPAKSPSAARP